MEWGREGGECSEMVGWLDVCERQIDRKREEGERDKDRKYVYI